MFTRHEVGKIALDLEKQEIELLTQLYGQLHDLLAEGEMEVDSDPFIQLMSMDGPTSISSDPALARLFPDAYLSDDEAASDFRRFTEPDLRRKKLVCVREVLAQLRGYEELALLHPDQVQNWLLSLNDLRLVLGTRIGVGEEDEDLPEHADAEQDPGYFLYDYLTYLQGSLVDVL